MSDREFILDFGTESRKHQILHAQKKTDNLIKTPSSITDHV